MPSDIKSLVARCGLCGFAARAMAGPEVATFYPNRKEWLAQCWQIPTASHPLACAELWKAVKRSSATRRA